MRFLSRFLIGCVAFLTGYLPCHAGDAISSPPRFEIYTTVDYSGDAAASVSSAVWSVNGPIDQPGIRLKVDMLSNIYGENDASVFTSELMAGMLGDLMAGYQLYWNGAWIKLYAGAAYQLQNWTYWEPSFWQSSQTISQHGFAAVVAMESYYRVNSRFWVSADASWLQFDNTTTVYDRAAYEVVEFSENFAVATGLETGAVIGEANVFYEGKQLHQDYVKAGALVNLRYWSNDLTLSAGMAEASEIGEWRPYATLTYGKKF